MNDSSRSNFTEAQSSELALLQQVMTLGTVFSAAVTAALLWHRSPVGAVLAGGMVLMTYSVVLAFEFLLMAHVKHGGTEPTPGLWMLIRAWWRETRVAAAVFAWRQPFRWRFLPDTLESGINVGEVSKQAGTRPVVFVHGLVCNRGFWHPWMLQLRAQGVPYVSVNLEPVFASIDVYAQHIQAVIQALEAGGHEKPMLVCHSMGGLVARDWLAARPGNLERIWHLVTIGSPHQGTWMARLSRTTSGRQMRMGSRWLAQLQERENASRGDTQAPRFTCWYSNADNIVFPASVATLPGADNRFVPGVAHVALAFHPRVMRESLAILSSGANSPMLRTAS
jgi:triacylglycerol lipase